MGKLESGEGRRHYVWAELPSAPPLQLVDRLSVVCGRNDANGREAGRLFKANCHPFGYHMNTPFGSACNHITNGGQIRSQYTARIIDIETRSMTDLVDWLTYSVSHAHQGVSCPREPPPIVRCQIARFRGDSSNSPNFFQPRTGCTCHVDKRRHQRRLRRFLSIPTGGMDHHRH